MNNDLHSTLRGDDSPARGENDPRESERHYRLLFENNPQPMWVFDSETLVFLEVNDAAIRQYEFSRDEFVSMNLEDIRPAEDIPALHQALSQHTSLRSEGRTPARHKRKDGSLIEVEVSWESLEFAGRPARLALLTDVTERRRAERALKESEARYQQLVELSPDAIVIHQDGRFVFVNSAALRLIGARDASEVIGKSIFDLVAPEFEEMLKQRVARLYQGELSPPIEIRGRRFDGVDVDCELASVPYTHHDRFAVLAVLRDISERKRAEQALREANQRALTDYERLVERIAMLGATLANARDLKSIFNAFRDFATVSVPCDGAAISLYDKQKEVRRAVYCWVDSDEVAPVEIGEVAVGNGIVGQALKSGRVTIENDFQRLIAKSKMHKVGSFEGDRFPRSSMTIPMSVLGRTIGCIEIQTYRPDAYRQEHATAMRMAASLAASAIENVTSIERAQQKEEQLRQAQKMEAVGQLAGGVAHDFNNLLTAINGYSDLTLRSLDEKSPLRPRIEEIRKAGERAASLTRQLLAFSRKQMLQPRVLDLNKVITEMGNMVRRLVDEDIIFELLLAPDLGKIKADAGQIEQVLLNLVVNARDVMPTGGHLTIETRNMYVSQPLINRRETLQPGHYVVLSVSDDGCGMDAETQERIFEPFFTTKELGKGTGLGLATVYGIVKQSEGYIWVYSEVGKGATFKIYLPRVDAIAETNEVSEASQPVRGGQETILLVEDEDIVRNLAYEVLQQYGYTVITAESGEEGLRVCREFAGKIDLVVTDVVMPRMSGREMAEQLATERPETRVLYMSGFTDDAIVRHGLLEEDIAFIQKPFTPESLATKIRELLDNVN
jgi:PAS domain S-box-containing protein